jgi:hypothetical protein
VHVCVQAGSQSSAQANDVVEGKGGRSST